MEDRIPVVRDPDSGGGDRAIVEEELASPVGQRKLKKTSWRPCIKDFQDKLVDVYFSDYLVE